MTRTPLLIMVAAAAALAGCNKENHTIVAGPADDAAAKAEANAQVQLPPSIAASKTYRCKDNKLIYVDWMSDGTAQVKTSPEAAGALVPAGSPQLKGDAKASSISYNGQSCKA
jgi:curli biogenesis system outer membrane secretion channel CsgG